MSGGLFNVLTTVPQMVSWAALPIVRRLASWLSVTTDFRELLGGRVCDKPVNRYTLNSVMRIYSPTHNRKRRRRPHDCCFDTPIDAN